jgi:Holliday junction DNA helicase RuvB
MGLGPYIKGSLVLTEEDFQMPETPRGIVYPEPRGKPVPSQDAYKWPEKFEDYVGQSEAKDLAQIMAEAANKERRALPNIMVVGEYGLGKTALARLLLKAVGQSERLYDGASINKGTPEPGTYIIDEIHNLNPEVADSLNIQLDQGKHHIIGCTNKPGLLPSAFRSRFRILQLHSYTTDELSSIVEKAAKRKAVKFDRDAIELVALRSRFNARQALTYLDLAFDLKTVNNQATLTLHLVESMFKKVGVDEKGLLPRDRAYLNALKPTTPVGIQYLAAVLGEDATTIEEEIEPYLMRLGYVDRTPRGRINLEGI